MPTIPRQISATTTEYPIPSVNGLISATTPCSFVAPISPRELESPSKTMILSVDAFRSV